jgi:putative membrane-bound dehydrogenase-like protein
MKRCLGSSMLLLWAAGVIHAAALSPNDERASFHFADPLLMVELVAAEPDVISPVAITWDARGRMFVAEMTDYPLGPAAGQIRILEDRDRDGRYETATVFADHLPFPNSVLPWNGGLLVTAVPDLLFLKDTDGDGRADERRVLFTGFAEGNQQLRANGLLWGLDGWVYGANGRSDGEVHRPGDAQAVSLRGHDFRFRPDTGFFEAVAGRSQFGLARDDWGNRFLSWNTIPIRHEVIPESGLNSRIGGNEGIHDLLPAGDTGEVFPLTPAPQTFNKESTSHFNALAGLTIYRGDALPSLYRGNAFMGETLRNLVHRRVLVPDGPTFVARRAEHRKEFLASTDPWFHPVNFATGPDGALYIVDFYRQWVEHPGYVPEKMRGEVAWRTGAEHGRIWRVRARETKLNYPGSNLELDRATTKELVRHLERTNSWWRDTAQRFILERRDASAVPALKKLALKAQSPVARVQAVQTLSALDALDNKTLLSALSDRHPRVRQVAIGFSGARLRHSGELLLKVAGLANDSDPRVRLSVAMSISGNSGELRVNTLEKLARRPDLDHFTALAIRSSILYGPWSLLQRLSTNNLGITSEHVELIRAIASDIGFAKNRYDSQALLASLADKKTSSSPENAFALFAGLASGLAANEPDWRNRLREWAPDYEGLIAQLVTAARNVVGRGTASLSSRKLALTTLARAGTPDAVATLLEFLLPPHDERIQSAAVSAINESGDPALFQGALSSWNHYQIATRRKLLAGAIRSTATAGILVDAVEQGRIAAAELDASVRQNLLQTKSTELKPRVKKLFEVPADCAVALEKFAAALHTSGDRKAGAELFSKLCLQCHAIEGQGQNVGPSLTGISSRPPEALLVDILDPSRQVASDFVGYTVTTARGDTFTGLIMSENVSAIVLRRPGVPDETIPRAEIKEVQASGRSLMPDGLETGLTPADLANLLEFLRQPDPNLLRAD